VVSHPKLKSQKNVEKVEETAIAVETDQIQIIGEKELDE